MQPSTSQVKSELYVAISAALVTKWPSNDERDFKNIANTAKTLTDILIDKYVNADEKAPN